MAKKIDQHAVIQKIKELANEYGRRPTCIEFVLNVGSKHSYEKHFGNWTNALIAAGFTPAGHIDEPKTDKQIKTELKMVKDYIKLCSKKEQIHGFFVHTLDLQDLFKRAGNPASLKVSAQPDTHVKFMDKPAVNCYLKFLEYYQPDVHIIMGDFLDCEGLSHWPSQDLEPRRIVPEVIEGKKLLEKIVNLTPKCSTRIFLKGNHSAWIEQAFTKMPELFDGLAELGIEINLKTMLGLEKLGYELYELNHLVKIGKAHFTHGIYTGNSHAKKHIDVFKGNIFYGHLHDIQSFNQTSLDGPMTAQSLGCLCRLDAKFLKGRPSNWVHAHGVFEVFPDGNFTYYVPNIIRGKMSFNGIIFDGNL